MFRIVGKNKRIKLVGPTVRRYKTCRGQHSADLTQWFP